MTDSDDRWQEIETKISFQEHLLEHLNEALTSQQQQLDALKKQVSHLVRLAESPREQIKHPEEESPPPHY